MDKNKLEYIDIIIGHLNNDITGEESESLNKWLLQDEQNKRLFDEVRDLWVLAGQSNSKEKFDTLTALDNVKQKIRKKQKNIVLSVNSILYRVAAIFIISFAIGVFFHYIYNNKISHNKEDLADLIEINAPKGSKSFVKLPDGSQVWLNSDSKLFYPPEFGKNERTVKLIGEAFFDVKKNADLPFKVNTSEVIINVTGTMFNLKAYPDENTIETTLEEGEVIIEKKGGKNNEKIITLKPKQRAVFIKDNNETIVSDVKTTTSKNVPAPAPNKVKLQPIVVNDNIDTKIFTSWKENKLVFRDEKLKEVFVRLERWYGVKINVIDDEILNYHFIGIIENETVTQVMKVIQFTLPIQFEIEQNVITIKKDNSDN